MPAVTYLVTAVNDAVESGASNPATLLVAPQNADYIGQTAQDLIGRVLNGLGVSWQTDIGELREGDFSPPERPRETTYQYILRKLNEGANDITRRGGFFLVRSGTQTLAAGGRTMRYQALATSDGSILWHAQAVTWTPDGGALKDLPYIGKGQALMRYGVSYRGYPVQYWTHIDESGVRLLDVPQVNGTVGISGPAVPPLLQTMTDFPGWLTPDLTHYLVTYARRAVCLKVQALAGRYEGENASLTEIRNSMISQAKSENPEMWAFVYGAGL